MAFIEKKNPLVLNIMLTSKGRELLSTGNLTFNYFAVGDSEINYDFLREINTSTDPDFLPSDLSVLKPRDRNADILSYIPQSLSGDPYNVITPSSIHYKVVNTGNTIGFFSISGSSFLTTTDLVKQFDGMIYMTGITGGNTISVKQSPEYGTNANEPEVNDLLLVRWTYDVDTTGSTITNTHAVPYLFYRVSGITGTLAADNLVITVDRELPDLSDYSPTAVAGAAIYYSAVTNNESLPTSYLNPSVLAFLNNYQGSTDDFPCWNLSIVYTEEIAGVQSTEKKFTEFATNKLGGFLNYIQNQSPDYKKLGIIHYTNYSPANTYAEELYENTPTLTIPTIMWHNQTSNILGVTLSASGSSKLLEGTTKSLNTKYFDLVDQSGNLVGKIFNELKLFVIEDQELLFAMSYKSNRSWTLPNFELGGGLMPAENCPTTTTTTIAPTTTTTTPAPAP